MMLSHPQTLAAGHETRGGGGGGVVNRGLGMRPEKLAR